MQTGEGAWKIVRTIFLVLFPILILVIGILSLLGIYFISRFSGEISKLFGIDISLPSVIFWDFLILVLLGTFGMLGMMDLGSIKTKLGFKFTAVGLSGTFVVLAVASLTVWSMAKERIVSLFFSGMMFTSLVYMFVLLDDIFEMIKSMRRGERVGDGIDAGR